MLPPVIHRIRRSRLTPFALLVACLPAAMLDSGCGGAASASPTDTTTTSSVYPAVYKTLTWGSGVTVAFPSSCEMTISSNGVPEYHAAYYLAPTSTQYPTQVASTPSGLGLAVVPYTPASIVSGSATIDICPTKASSPTTTNMGPIGYIVSGEFLYNAYEATSTPALGDNVSYTFISGGTTYTASFIDACNSHPTPLTMGYTWHYHGVPLCVTATEDGASGPSHISGIALDGYPVYGGRDINGNVISVSQLDACNGITSATPELPNGAYHYALPIGVTTGYSSMNCYTGTVSGTAMAEMKKLACRMFDGKKKQPKKSTQPDMTMDMKGMERGM